MKKFWGLKFNPHNHNEKSSSLDAYWLQKIILIEWSFLISEAIYDIIVLFLANQQCAVFSLNKLSWVKLSKDIGPYALILWTLELNVH